MKNVLSFCTVLDIYHWGRGLWPIEASYHPCDLGGWWQDKSVTVTVSSWSPNGGALLGIFSGMAALKWILELLLLLFIGQTCSRCDLCFYLRMRSLEWTVCNQSHTQERFACLRFAAPTSLCNNPLEERKWKMLREHTNMYFFQL